MAEPSDSVNAKPLVSVIIPAFDAGAWIEESLESVVQQTYSPLEVLVADDGSTDDTGAKVEAFSRRHPNVRWIPAAGRAGRPAVPRNRALAAARGEFVAFLDADDLWSPWKLEDQVNAMAANPSLVLVYSILRSFGPGVRFFSSHFGLKPVPFYAAHDSRTLERGNTVPLSSAIARRDAVVVLGGFDEDPELRAVEDYHLWVRLSRYGAIGFIPRVHGFYRVHDQGISRNIAEQRRRAEYLVRKLGLERFTFREFKERSVLRSVLRNAADLLTTIYLKTHERIDRAVGAVVPVRQAKKSRQAQALPSLSTEERFQFGENWRSFLSTLSADRIAEAERSLTTMLGRQSLEGLRFLDVGCGSGLFSLAAMRLGASTVHSFDYDPVSVACAQTLRERFFPSSVPWTVECGSALDRQYLERLGTWDIVYSWGVLHHTGAMWQAIRNVAATVAPGGSLFISIYNDQGLLSRFWKLEKRLYNTGNLARMLMTATFIPVFLARGFVRDVILLRRNPLTRYREYRKTRGMSVVHDWADWLGGYPFEVARPEQVLEVLKSGGFVVDRVKTCGRGLGCNEFVFHREQAAAETTWERPLQVVFLIRALDVGGAERQLVELASGLDRRRFNPAIYCLLSASGPLAEDARRKGIEVYSAGLRGLRPWNHPVRLVRQGLKMVRDLRSLDPAILHAFLFHAYTTGAFLSRIVRARTFVSSRRSLGHFKSGRPFALLLERAANRFADVVVANSGAVRDDVIAQERLAPHRVVVIHNGIDVSGYPCSPSSEARRQFNASESTAVVAMVANFIAYKGHRCFLSAWRLVQKSSTSAVAVLIGDGPLRKQIEELVVEMGLADSVRFLGNRSDVPQLLSAVDLVVHPSEQEGFCNVILEAMAASQPVIATAVGGNAEAIVDGETGLLVPPNDPASLATAIEQLLGAPERRQQLGRAGRLRVEQRFGVQRMTQAYEGLYRTLLGRAASKESVVAKTCS